MSLHRFFVPPQDCQGARIELADAEAHHALRVLRVRQGDEVTALDGAGGVLRCKVASVGRKDCVLEVVERTAVPAPPCRVTLFQAIPKGKTLDGIIQKATELGVSRIVPLFTSRVVARPGEREFGKKAEKWQTIAIEAVKQCGQPWMPLVEAPVDLPGALRSRQPQEMEFVGALSAAARHPREWFDDFARTHNRAPVSAAVWIGPEGDFAPEELEAVVQAGVRPISLGPLVLRCETAAIYSLSLVQYETSGAR
jgi:16S rRNA (uracil1498-N3)-methyltransferase